MAGRFLLPSASLPLLLFPFSDSRFSSSLSFLRVPFSLSLSLSLSLISTTAENRKFYHSTSFFVMNLVWTGHDCQLWASGLRFFFCFPDIGDLFLPGFSLRYSFAGPFDHSTRIVGNPNMEPRFPRSWIELEYCNCVIDFFFFVSKLRNCLIRQLSKVF